MTDLTLTRTRICAGYWEGVLTADPPVAEPPALELRHEDRRIALLDPVALDRPGAWALRVPLPLAQLSEGVQTFVITGTGPGGAGALGHFTVIAGAGEHDDLRAEVDLLRAELDMLKRAFRRHCLETAPEI